jgi:hypothetical protein
MRAAPSLFARFHAQHALHPGREELLAANETSVSSMLMSPECMAKSQRSAISRWVSSLRRRSVTSKQ